MVFGDDDGYESHPAVSPERLRDELEHVLALVPTLQLDLGLTDAELETFAALLREGCSRALPAHEPTPALRDLLDQFSSMAEFLTRMKGRMAFPGLLDSLSASLRARVHVFLGQRREWEDDREVWHAADPAPLFRPRNTTWAMTAGGARFRLWSFWTPWEWQQAGPPPHSEDDAGRLTRAPVQRDLGDALLERLDRDGWADLRARHLELLGAMRPLGLKPPSTTDELRGFRAWRRAEFGPTPGLWEGPIVLGRLAAILGPLRADVDLFPEDPHEDCGVRYSVHLEVQSADGARARAWASDDERDGLPWIWLHGGDQDDAALLELAAVLALLEDDAALLEDLVETLLAEPTLADVEVPWGGGVLGVRGGRLVCEPTPPA